MLIFTCCIGGQVAMVGFPPTEAREDSLTALGRADLFGTGVNPQQMERMAELEVRWPASRTVPTGCFVRAGNLSLCCCCCWCWRSLLLVLSSLLLLVFVLLLLVLVVVVMVLLLLCCTTGAAVGVRAGCCFAVVGVAE